MAADKIIGKIVLQKEIFGSELYTISIEITNLTDSVLNINSIVPELLPGEIISVEESASTTELDELEELKRKLVRELNLQVSSAYESLYHKTSNKDKFLENISATLSVTKFLTATFSTNGLINESKPLWANQALKINEWSDVEKLEAEIINNLTDDSFLKKAFIITKEKLKNCLTNISDQNSNGGDIPLEPTFIIQPKETAIFPFRCVAPYQYSSKEYDVQFTISYKSENLDIQGNYPIRDLVKVFASKSAITFGSVLGSLLGFSVKCTLVSSFQWFDKAFWSNLIGSITLAIILGITTAKSIDSKKIITIENFAGGLLIGAVCAMYSSKIILYLEQFIPK